MFQQIMAHVDANAKNKPQMAMLWQSTVWLIF